MNEKRLKLLQQMADGIIIFEPFYRRSKEMMEFQEMAEELLQMSREGLIGRCYTQEHEIAGQSYIDQVVIYEGLTGKGREALRSSLDGENNS